MSELDLVNDDDLENQLRALPTEQRNEIFKNFLNQDQQALQLPYQFTRPETLGQGLRNFASNATLGIRQSLGLQPTIKGQLANQQYLENLLDMQLKTRDIKRETDFRNFLKDNTKIDPALIDSASLETLESLYGNLTGKIEYIPGAGVAQRNLSTNQTTILGNATNDVKEYEIVVAQIGEKNKKLPVEEQMPIPSFQDYVEQKKVVERTPPAALQIFDRMREINPEIDQLPPEQQTELLETIMRQGRDPAYVQAESLARLTGQLGGVTLTPGEIELDKKFAVTVAEYENAGGFAASRRNYKELNGLIAGLLAEPRDGSSSISGRVVFATPDIAKSSKAIDTKDQIDRIITQDLKATLGAQFSQQEGERFVAYAYNIMLPPHINAKRLARMRNAMEEGAKAKRDSIAYFKRKGTLKGYKGAEVSKEKIYGSVFKEEDYANFTDKELAEMFANIADDPNAYDAEFEVIADILMKRDVDLSAFNIR